MISQFLSNNPFIPSINSQLKTHDKLIENQNKSNIFIQKTIIPSKDEQQQQQQAEISKTYSVTNNKQSIKVTSHVLTRRSPEGYKNLRAKTIRVGKIRWPPPINTDETDHANQQRRLLVQRRIKEEIHGNEQIAKDHISNDKKPLLSDYDDDTSTNEMIVRNKKSFGLMLDKESYQLRKNLFEHLNKSSFVGMNNLFYLINDYPLMSIRITTV
ncbi:unnamed protein product [Rotaria magnacalcarata]|uniref:Uncharacterized protein n=1 Tax=Rotaria magnacalcarata TaxID=392030 RepID=A0A816Y1U1_9BILA|nr:unnamed protein product [Rotaria magnacalcarata]